MDVLAVWDRAKLNGQTPPTVICTGGVGVLLCFGNEEVRKILIDAQQVTFYAENELSSEKQAQTDAWRARQIGRVAEIRGVSPDQVGSYTHPRAAKISRIGISSNSRRSTCNSACGRWCGRLSQGKAGEWLGGVLPVCLFSIFVFFLKNRQIN